MKDKIITQQGSQDPLPEQLGHYRFVKKLGEGGMGIVYQAEDLNLGRSVALKILPTEVASDPKRLRRFQREAKAASSLNHPNITHIYEVGEDGGVHFIAMEHVEGETLQRLIELGALPATELIDVALQITGALQEAHQKGIVHRDIKPSNIMIASGIAKVLDFGLARIDTPHSTSNATTDARTEPGLLLGTVQYMSPEQALGNVTDARSDIFSLGIVLYEAATGRHPFSGSGAPAIIDRILHGVPEPIARFNPSVPAELERTIFKCLRKEPAERYQSMRDLAADLTMMKREISSDRSTPVETSPPEYSLSRNAARMLFLALQMLYMIFYVSAARWTSGIEAGLAYVFGGSAGSALTLVYLITAIVGIAVRLYLITNVLFDHVQTGVRYRLAFPFLFVLDELWAASPLSLSLRIGPFPALACVAPLAFSPFSQRTLMRSAYDFFSPRRISTDPHSK